MSEYRTCDPGWFRCNEDVGGCDEIFRAKASVHKETGVPGVTCPLCGKTQEPMGVSKHEVRDELFEEIEDEYEADARAEIEAERKIDERRERHFDRHGHFGPGRGPGPD